MVMQEPCWLNHKLVVLIFTNTCIVQLNFHKKRLSVLFLDNKFMKQEI